MIAGFHHLSEDRLIEACTLDSLEPRELEHLQRCRTCSTRRADIESLVAEVSLAARTEADAAFPPDRLARQRARIMSRVNHDNRPGRVLSFPGHAGEATPVRKAPRTRWVAGAAAAGLVIGLVAGRVSHDFSPRPSTAAVNRPSPAPVSAASDARAEEELLGQIELAVATPGGRTLGTLNALTPRAWEVK